VIGVPVRLCELDGLARKAKARAPLERSRWPIDNHRAKKVPAEGIGRRLRRWSLSDPSRCN
jgi:hypothetical protein